MSFLLGILIFVLALLFSIMLHEAGHFVTAKKFGMKVTQFFVGFGQTLWSRRKGETEYGVKAIPAGGFVKIVGMTELEDVDPADEPRSFRRQPGWQRIIVLAAGSFMHFVLAFVLLFALAVGSAWPARHLDHGRGHRHLRAASLTAACSGRRIPPRPPSRPASAPETRSSPSPGRPVRNWTQMGKALRRQPAGHAGRDHRAARRAAADPDAPPGRRPRPPGVVPGHLAGRRVPAGRAAGRGHLRGRQVRPDPGRVGRRGGQPAKGGPGPVRQEPRATPRAARSPAWSAPRT